MKKTYLALIAAIASTAPMHSFADSLFVTVVGQTQGKFKGSATNARFKGAIPAQAYSFQVSNSANVSTGAGAGRANFQPITITKHVDASSAQFFRAAVTGENLTSVSIQGLAASASGKQESSADLILTNAIVVNISQGQVSASGVPMEQISFVFQQIKYQEQDAEVPSPVQ